MTLSLNTDVLQWARRRSGLSATALAKKLGVKADRVVEWEADGELTPKQAENLAQKTNTPYGFLFLSEPPEEKLPVPDFRTLRDGPPRKPSPNLLDTVHSMQRRQAWLREYLIEEEEEPKAFVGQFNLQSDYRAVAAHMKELLSLESGWARRAKTWTDALRVLREQVEEAGIIIVFNGVVGNNTSRVLDVEEFRGFALVDEYAPLVFINGSDFKGAQMFTLAHELAHLWIGAEGVSNLEAMEAPPIDVEIFCNKVAAEFLVHADELQEYWYEADLQDEPFQWLARRFKVSAIVAARRALDLGLIDRPRFFEFFEAYKSDERRKAGNRSGGGSFWLNQNTRVGRRYGRLVIEAAKQGRIVYQEAFKLLDMHGKTFDRYAEQLGFKR
jgi:Zn-dependent peptidase ImmA (M78 family)